MTKNFKSISIIVLTFFSKLTELICRKSYLNLNFEFIVHRLLKYMSHYTLNALECLNEVNFPLKGIMHPAGVLSDGSFENQTWEKYEETFQPKVKGAWNFHNLTKDTHLEFFVLFSSALSCVGGLAQSNYCAANSFLDHLATHSAREAYLVLQLIGDSGEKLEWPRQLKH